MKPVRVKVKLPRKKPDPVAPFPGHGHVCLNCGQEVSNNFCSVCGQSTATHRLSIKHFVLHDLVHSIWHVDRGIFFTLKEVLISPGYAALEYIRGKRAGRFPILTLLLLLAGLFFWLRTIGAPNEAAIVTKIDVNSSGAEFARQFLSFILHNKKWILLGLIPVGSLSTLIAFRRTRLNYTEHVLVNSYILAGLLVFLVITKLVMLALPVAAETIDAFRAGIGFLFYLFGYWQAYHAAYSLRAVIWRYMLLFMLNTLFLIVVLFLVAVVISVFRPDLIRPGVH